MSEINVLNSVITGLHITKTSSHPSIRLVVLADDSARAYDNNCLKVIYPSKEDISPSLMEEVVWPKNPRNKRFRDQLVSDIIGKKVGNVPANLCGLFKNLVESGKVKKVFCISTGTKPRASLSPPTRQSFKKMASGRDRRGGGVVLDCKYVLRIRESTRDEVVQEIQEFLSNHDGTEVLGEL